tara:strand:- start:200 stop:637 length:438 start_codon:yes stop_codon:yes gene_type:complete
MSTLTTKIKESITLNGKVYGNEITKTHASITTVRQSIVDVDSGSSTELFNFAAARAGLGTVQDAKAKYIRLTNLDSSNFIIVNLFLDLSTDEYAAFKVFPGGSLVLTKDATKTGSRTTSLTQLDGIHAKADTADCQVEIFIAEIN